jgi:hypothetical protein
VTNGHKTPETRT